MLITYYIAIICVLYQFSKFTRCMSTVSVIKAEDLFVSQPNPMYFGNSANDENNIHWTNKNWLKSRFHFNFAEYWFFYVCYYGNRRTLQTIY